MRTQRIVSLVFAGLAVSCNSLNTYHYSTPNSPPVPGVVAGKPTPDDEAAVFRAGRSKDVVLVCPPFVFPLIPEIPSLPLEKLRQINPKNPKATELIDKLMQEHLADVRKNSELRITIVQNAHDEYMKNCRAAATKQK